MNSCIAILLVLGANPYQPVNVSPGQGTAPGQPAMIVAATPSAMVAQQPRLLPGQRFTYQQPLTIQRPLVIYQPSIRQTGAVQQRAVVMQPQLLQQPVIVYQSEPQFVAQPIHMIQSTMPTTSYDEPIPETNDGDSSAPQPLTAGANGMPISEVAGSCGCSGEGTCGGSCDSGCGSSCGASGCCLSNLLNVFGNKCDCGCGCNQDNKYHGCASTYDMPQHIPYPPAYHGYYYYRPYNYRHVLYHQQNLLGESSIAPYTTLVFEQVYAEFPKESYNPDPSEQEDDPYFEPAPKKLPSLTDLLDG